MKKIVLSALLVLLGFGINAKALADTKIAVIDIPAIVAKSAQVKALTADRKAKVKELENWLKTAQTEINKQKTDAEKEKLAKKYQADFSKKQEAIASSYQRKLEAADKSITQTIVTEAKKLGYDIVISKGVVLYGGTDITSQIQKVVK